MRDKEGGEGWRVRMKKVCMEMGMERGCEYRDESTKEDEGNKIAKFSGHVHVSTQPGRKLGWLGKGSGSLFHSHLTQLLDDIKVAGPSSKEQRPVTTLVLKTEKKKKMK